MANKATLETQKPRSRIPHPVSSRIQRKAPLLSPNIMTTNTLYNFQRTIGNQAVGQLNRAGIIQAKLKIGKPNDKYEREADQVADRVMNMPDTSLQRQVTPGEKEEIQQKPLAETIFPLVQRHSEDEEEVETKTDRSGNNLQSAALESGIASLKGRGTTIPRTERSFFEPRFGANFRNVKIHSGSNASSLANSIQAKAFTVGNNIVFGQGQYNPGTSHGRRLLGHELTHVVQQNRGVGGDLIIRRVPSTRALLAAQKANQLKAQTSPAIWFDDWGDDKRDNDLDGVVDGTKEKKPKDGMHYHKNPWKAFICINNVNQDSPSCNKQSINVNYLVCIDIPRIAFRAAGLPFPWASRSVARTVYLLRTSRKFRQDWKILRNNFLDRPGFNGKVQKGDFVAIVRGSSGHSGVAVDDVNSINLPGPSTRFTGPNIKNDIEKNLVIHQFIARPK